ncbi:MAG: hypothetical protein ACLQAR_06990 [Steroidobacteraceae bacterium]
MSLPIRINMALSLVFVCAAGIAGYACWTILEANARIRAYTANQILPLPEQRAHEADRRTFTRRCRQQIK